MTKKSRQEYLEEIKSEYEQTKRQIETVKTKEEQIEIRKKLRTIIKKILKLEKKDMPLRELNTYYRELRKIAYENDEPIQGINIRKKIHAITRQALKLEQIPNKFSIVDDNKLNIKVARRTLEAFHVQMDECYNGQECIDKVKSGNQYDIILMDIMMPEMSGITALQELKKTEKFQTPVIAVTADAIANSEEKYLKEGFTDYISKPFTKEQIQEKLVKILKENQEVSNVEIL